MDKRELNKKALLRFSCTHIVMRIRYQATRYTSLRGKIRNGRKVFLICRKCEFKELKGIIVGSDPYRQCRGDPGYPINYHKYTAARWLINGNTYCTLACGGIT